MPTPEDMQDVDKLLHQMRDVMQSLGGDSNLEAEEAGEEEERDRQQAGRARSE